MLWGMRGTIIHLKVHFYGVLKQVGCNKVTGAANREVDSARYWTQEKTVWNQYNKRYSSVGAEEDFSKKILSPIPWINK